MRKSFILSLVMVVVLIASLATATFAWFTAQVKVQTNEVIVTAASATDSIVVSAATITANTQTNQSVTLTAPEAAGNEPMVIKAANEAAFNAYNLSTFANLKTTLTSSGVTLVAAGDAAPAQAALVAGVAGDTDSTSNNNGYIYLANVGANEHNYNVKVTINDGANKGLRVAVFRAQASSGTFSATDFALVGIWCPTGETVRYANAIAAGALYSGTFAAETAISPSTSDSDYIFASGSAATKAYNSTPDTLTLTAFDADTNDVIAVRVYFEGDKVGNAQAAATANFAIEFNLVNA